MANIHDGAEVIYNESVSNVTATPSIAIGMERRDEGGSRYVYVYNGGADQISQGQYGVIMSGASGYSVTVSSTTFVDVGVGVAKNATLTTGAYGWLMYRGFSGLSTANVSGVTGQVLLLGPAGKFDIATAAAGSFVTAVPVGKLLVSVATGVTNAANAFLNFM